MKKVRFPEMTLALPGKRHSQTQLVGWVERQRYPSISYRDVDGFREGLNPSYGLRAWFAIIDKRRSV
jgi:hypothetical protein